MLALLAALFALVIMTIIPFYVMMVLTFLFRKKLIYRSLNGDGWAFWQPFKLRFAERDHIHTAWRCLPDFNHFKELKEKEGDINHFLFQLYGIQQEKPTARKLMQIALNIGQFIATVPISKWHQHHFEWKMLWIGMYMSPTSILRLTVGW